MFVINYLYINLLSIIRPINVLLLGEADISIVCSESAFTSLGWSDSLLRLLRLQ